MRVLRCIHSLESKAGGTATATVDTSSLLIPEGFDITIASLDPVGVSLLPIPDGCTVLALGPGSGFYGYSPIFKKWLREHIASFDAVIVEGCWQYHGLAVWQEARRAGVPYAVFPHGMLDPWFKRTYPIKHLKKWLYWPWAEYRILRDAKAVFFTTEQERLLARQSFWLYRARERVIPFGIRDPQVDRDACLSAFESAYPHYGAEPFLLFLGRIYEKKGVDLLLEVFARHPLRKRVRLLLAGPIGNASFERQVKNALGSGRVDWIPMLSGDAKWGALAAAEALILPSHQENFGLVIPEALAMGTPVLTTHPVNIAPLVESSGSGLVSVDDLAGVHSLLDSWSELDASARSQMKKSARPAFERHFNMDTMAKDFTRVLIDALKSD